MTELRKDATVLALIWLTLWQYQLICSPVWNGNLRKRHCEVCNRNTISIVYSFDLTLETWKDVCYRNTVSSTKTVFTFCIHRAHCTQHVPKDKTLGKPDYKGAILRSILHRHCYWHGFRVFILLSSITAEKLVSCECQISFCCALYSPVSVNINGILLITLTHRCVYLGIDYLQSDMKPEGTEWHFVVCNRNAVSIMQSFDSNLGN